MSAFTPTSGLHVGGKNTCNVVSCPALGVREWEGLVSSQAVAYCVCWTGRDNSPESEWFEPWKKNVAKAVAAGHTLIIIDPNCIGGGGRKMGKGQSKELAYLKQNGIESYIANSSAQHSPSLKPAVRTVAPFWSDTVMVRRMSRTCSVFRSRQAWRRWHGWQYDPSERVSATTTWFYFIISR